LTCAGENTVLEVEGEGEEEKKQEKAEKGEELHS
jgi:hypothetical protein